jgi:hypothetical protein
MESYSNLGEKQTKPAVFAPAKPKGSGGNVEVSQTEERCASYRATQTIPKILRPRISDALRPVKITKRFCASSGLLESGHHTSAAAHRVVGKRMLQERVEWKLSILTVP